MEKDRSKKEKEGGAGLPERRRVVLTSHLNGEICTRNLGADLARRVTLLFREALNYYGLPESSRDGGFYLPAVAPTRSHLRPEIISSGQNSDRISEERENVWKKK
jgi:hypothetical protein